MSASKQSASWWQRAILVVAAPVLFVVGVEVVLRVAGAGYPTTFLVERSGRDGVLVDNPHFGRRYFPAGLLRVPPPMRVTRQKAEGVVRVILFGESAAMGDPRPGYGVARYLEVLLRERFPERKFEVIPMAMTAINSHALVSMAREAGGLGADAWVVFAGNNEILGPFGAGTTLGQRTPPLGLVRAILAVKATRLGQSLERLAGRLRPGPVGSSRWAGTRVLAGENVAADSPERARVYAAFERNVSDIVEAGRDAGVRVLLSTVAVNLRDCAPFGSASTPGLAESTRAEWLQAFEAGRAAFTHGAVDGAAGVLRRAVELDPVHAEARFLLARAVEGASPEQARGLYEGARDADIIPLRTDSRLNGIIREVAGRAGVVLVDAATLLGEGGPSGVPGGGMFYEHVHLTPEGNYALARVFAESLARELGLDSGADAEGEWAGPEACAAKLMLTAWNRAAAAEAMLRRCVDAPFTNQVNHDEHVRMLATEVSRQRRAQTPEGAAAVRAAFTNALAQAPDDLHLLRAQGEFLEMSGDLAGAAGVWARVVELLPHHPVAYYQAGSLHRRTGKAVESEAMLRKAVALQPDWMEARLELSELLQALGRTGEAVAAAREALTVETDHARAHFRLANALAADRQQVAALGSLERAVELDPRLWEARYLLGVEYALKDRIEDARVEFAEVVRVRPDHARARFNLGIALARQRRWAEAVQHLAEAVRLDPRHEAAKQALAQAEAMRRAAAEAPPLVVPQ